ncbi:hypothetical protein AXX12_18140 [Anaerosporomusa subterranea]|uniref:YetF C-terminal domain-containing protein n=1 Tax=Anaerosporomusa subterranea TaxID=1794912 RepID=A0A154BUE6_ANASB|nr:YetF domain-containing protein [Anaerosporomusa subterranea]KYZ77653.1 hypothetical protein AXX12_18140 [Anaerosporomusa subterranea]
MFEYNNAGLIILRLALIFTAALIVVRKMGNRTVGQLSPFDFVLLVGIGDIVVTIALETDRSLLPGIETLVGLLLLQQILGWLALKSTTLRKWVEGVPIELIEDGRLLKDNFVKTHFNYDDLRQELHKQGMDLSNLKDIKLARLESCGEFTVVRTWETEPLTRGDFEAYLNSSTDNPLSPQGRRWARIEQALEDVHFIAETLKQQPPVAPRTGEAEVQAKNLE